ncbi:MAG: hypothetical protein ACOYD1_13730 [Candidatus Nanopelagicales bacterium]
MTRDASTLTTEPSSPTQHAMLIAWGHFARTLGLTKGLADLPIDQKAVVRAPHEKVIEFLVGLLSGIEYLSDLSEGPTPLARDSEVAKAWQLQPMADASGVSRTLAACDLTTVQALQAVLDALGQPFLDRAVSDLRQRRETLVLDVDLTGRPVSSTSRTFPGAEFGYMDGEIRLGYQLAEICLQTRLFGRQWLSAQQHPGDTLSAPCLLGLVQAAERRLGCHPRRRTELLEQRLGVCEQTLQAMQQQLTHIDPRLVTQLERCESLQGQIQAAETHIQTLLNQPASSRQSGPYSLLSRLRKQVAGWERHLRHAQQRVAQLNTVMQHQRQRAQQALDLQTAEWQRLRARHTRLCQENACQANPPHCKMRTDAGFASGENLTELIELGYDVETKSGNPAIVTALRSRVTPETVWAPVGKNAEMVAWTGYQSHTCPYPLTVGLERFHTPQGVLHAVLLRYQDATPTSLAFPSGPPGLDLVQWFHDYNGRQTVEAGNKEEKTTFKVQHLMSHSPAGIEIQALLTVFAANFVRWADHWVRERVEYPTKRFETALGSPKRLVRVAANSPATVEHAAGQEALRFSPLSCFGGVMIRLSAEPGYQLPLPFIGNDHFDSA